MQDSSEELPLSKRILILLGFLFIAGVPILIEAPQLVSDIRGGGAWTAATDLKVKSAECTRYAFVASACAIEYVKVDAPEKVAPSLHYLVYGGWGGENVVMLRSAADPESITTIQGIRDLGARKLTLGVYLAFFLFFLIGVLKIVFGGPTRSAGPNAVLSRNPVASAPAAMRPASQGPATFGRRS